jgi:hypothetical protein
MEKGHVRGLLVGRCRFWWYDLMHPDGFFSGMIHDKQLSPPVFVLICIVDGTILVIPVYR